VTGQARTTRASVLRDRSVFEAVLRTGCRISSRNFLLRAQANELTHARLGMIAGKKVAARAVDRNRAKRLIREAFRAAAAGLGAVDVTVQLRSDLRRESAQAVRGELGKLLEKLAARGATRPTAPTGQ
jgi:ribonuclease P protein component